LQPGASHGGRSSFELLALVDLRVCVTELDGDVSLELILESDGEDARDGFDDGGLSVGDVTDRSCKGEEGGREREKRSLERSLGERGDRVEPIKENAECSREKV
jgi:hypothetical protein